MTNYCLFLFQTFVNHWLHYFKVCCLLEIIDLNVLDLSECSYSSNEFGFKTHFLFGFIIDMLDIIYISDILPKLEICKMSKRCIRCKGHRVVAYYKNGHKQLCGFKDCFCLLCSIHKLANDTRNMERAIKLQRRVLKKVHS